LGLSQGEQGFLGGDGLRPRPGTDLGQVGARRGKGGFGFLEFSEQEGVVQRTSTSPARIESPFCTSMAMI